MRVPILREAITHTAEKRDSLDDMTDWQDIVQDIRDEDTLHSLWKNYQADNTYAVGIAFEQVVDTVEEIGKLINR